MKRIALTLALITGTLLAAGPAAAQEQYIGLGIMIGEPTGLNAKVWWDDTMAFDAGLAWSFVDDTELSLHTDMLWHNWTVLEEALDVEGDIRLPLYWGVGGRIKAGDENRVGVRFVGGVSLLFVNAPVDLFLEVAPIMDIAPATTLRMHSGLGFRIWF